MNKLLAFFQNTLGNSIKNTVQEEGDIRYRMVVAGMIL